MRNFVFLNSFPICLSDGYACQINEVSVCNSLKLLHADIGPGEWFY